MAFSILVDLRICSWVGFRLWLAQVRQAGVKGAPHWEEFARNCSDRNTKQFKLKLCTIFPTVSVKFIMALVPSLITPEILVITTLSLPQPIYSEPCYHIVLYSRQLSCYSCSEFSSESPLPTGSPPGT